MATLRPLSTEDGQNGYWDAKRMGNGQGRSFIVQNGVQTFVTDEELQRIINGGSPTAAPALPPTRQAQAPAQAPGNVTLNIGGKRVKVGNEFLAMTPEQQNAAVEEIAAQMGVRTPQVATPAAAVTAGQAASPTSKPATEPAWGAPGALVPIQFQEGTGAARLAMPQLLTDAWNAIQAPGKALQGEYDEVRVGADGAVEPFDRRMMDDAANLASMVTPVTPAARIAAPAAKGAARAAVPEIDDLYAIKDAAYANVDKLGARYSDEAIDSLYADMFRRVGEANIDPAPDGVHKAAVRLLERLEDRRGPVSLGRLDQLRQQIRRDVIDSGTKGDAEMGRHMIDAIDDFIEKAGPGQISGATGQTANWAITTARKANTVLRKSETLQDALNNARLRAASTGSGGNIDNAIRQELRKIVQNPKKSRGFTKDELAQMEAVIMGGGKLQDMLRLVGKLSPSGNGLMAALGLGATVTNPMMAAGPAAGLVAKSLADRATAGNVEKLTNTVRTGGSPPIPRIGASPLQPKATTTLLEQNLGPRLLELPNGQIIRLDA